MRRWLAITLGILLFLVLAVYIAAGTQPALRFAIQQAKAAGLEIDAKQLRGNLFSGVEAVDATVKSAFINGKAASVKAKYNLGTLIQKRELRLEASLAGGRFSFDPVGLPPIDPKAPPAPIAVFLDQANLTDTEVDFIGKKLFVPDGKITLLEQTALPSRNGSIRGNLRANIETKDGKGFTTTLYEFGKDLQPNLVIDADVDAAIANHWLLPIPMKIEQGKIRGTITVTPTTVTVDANVQNGALEVLPGVVARAITGKATLNAAGQVVAKLSGQGLGGAINANVLVNTTTKKEYLQFSGVLRPKLEQVLPVFAKGTAGQGQLEVRLQGQGWEKIKITGTVNGEKTVEVAGFPLEQLKSTWQFTDHLEADVSALTRIGADKLNASAVVKSQGERILVDAKLLGKFLQSPLALNANVNVLKETVQITAGGTILRGTADAKLKIVAEKISGNGKFNAIQLPLEKPVVSNINGTAVVAGTVQNMKIIGLLNPARLEIPGLGLKDIAGNYALNFNAQGLSGTANLAKGAIAASGAIINTDGSPARGQVALQGIAFEPGGKADYTAQYVLNSAGVALAGNARGYDLRFGEANLDDVTGQLTLSVGQRIRGRWNANKLLTTLTENSLNIRPRAWRVQAAGESAFLSGDMTLAFEGLRTSGKLEARNRFGILTAAGTGSSLNLAGNAGYNGIKAALSGTVQLEPFSLRLAAVPQSKNLGGRIVLEAGKTLKVSGNLLSNGQNVQIKYNETGLEAIGKIDFSALAAALPTASRNLVSGIATLNIRNSSGTTTMIGNIAGLPLEATITAKQLKLSAQARVTSGQFAGATLSGAVFPQVNALAKVRGVEARVSGAYDDLLIRAAGRLPESLLAGTGLSLAKNSIDLTGRVKNGNVTVAGVVAGLTLSNARLENGAVLANFSGNINAAYQNKPLRLSNIRGNLSQQGSSILVSAVADSASGTVAGNTVQGGNVQVRFVQKNTTNTINFSAATARGVFANVPARVSNASGIVTLRDNQLAINVKAASAAAQTKAGTAFATNIAVSGNGTATQLPLRWSAGRLEGNAIGANAVLEAVNGSLMVARSIAGNVKFATGRIKHPQATVLLGAGTVSGRLNGQNLETQMQLPSASTVFRGEKIQLAATASVALNLTQANQNWRGKLDAKANGKDWRLTAIGDWQNLQIAGTLPTRLSSLAGINLPATLQSQVIVNGSVAIPDLRYNLGLISRLGIKPNSLQLSASLKGQAADYVVKIEALDATGGTGQATYNARGQASVRLNQLDLAAVLPVKSRLSGSLRLEQQSLRGDIGGEVVGLPIQAKWLENDAFTGNIGGAVPLRIRSAKWRFPLNTILNLETEPSDYPIYANASVNLQTLRGQGRLDLLETPYAVSNGQIALRAQKMPFQIALQSGLRLRLESKAGSLLLNNNQWQGELGFGYLAFQQAGTVVARFSGQLANPRLQLETTGLLQATGSGTIQTASASGRLALQPILGSLPKEYQKGIKAGSAQLEATWRNNKLSFKTRLLGTQLDQQTVDLVASGVVAAQKWNASSIVKVGASSSLLEVSDSGINAQKLDLDLRLAQVIGINLSGRIQGQLALPRFAINQMQGNIMVQNAKGFGFSANGTIKAQNGIIESQLTGTTPINEKYSIAGMLYPNLNAEIALGKLQGQAIGRRLEFADRVLDLTMQGSLLEKTAGVTAKIRGNTADIRADWDAAQLLASGNLEQQIASGTLNIKDLQGLTGVAGQATAQLEWRDNQLRIENINALAAGYTVKGAAKYVNSELILEPSTVQGIDVQAVAKGQIFPVLALQGTAKTAFAYLPSTLSWQASGTLEQPLLEANGVLGEASLGLVAPDTKLEAKFDGKKWRVQFMGAALSGVIDGGIPFVSSANLRINAPLVFSDNRLAASGAIAWTGNTGFIGGLNVKGDLFGQAGSLDITGRRQLEVRSSWRGLRLKATLPSQIGAELDAKIEVEKADLGAFYGKPNAFWLEGTGVAQGAWTKPELDFTGLLKSSDGLLNSKLGLNYDSAVAGLTIEGAAIKAKANWRDGKWQAVANSSFLALEPYLPKNLLPVEFQRLVLSSQLEASGDNKTWRAKVTDMVLTGRALPVGEFKLRGLTNVSNDNIETKLDLEVLAGTAVITAQINQPFAQDAQIISSVQMKDLDARLLVLESMPLQGLLSGSATLKGDLLNPKILGKLDLINAGLQSEQWHVSSSLELGNQLLNPDIAGVTKFIGDAAGGELTWRVGNALSDAPTVQLVGDAYLPFVKASSNLSGTLPNLLGTLVLQQPSIAKSIKISATGDGKYAIQSQDLVSGAIQIATQKSWLESALTGRITFDGNTEQLIKGFAAQLVGDVVLGGKLVNPEIRLENAVLTREAALVRLGGSVFPQLDLVGIANSDYDFIPVKLDLRILGAFTKPDVRVSGLFGTATLGLVAPDTKLDGFFDGTNWRVQLTGDALSGEIEGGLTAITKSNLQLNAPVLFEDTRLTATGKMQWEVVQGFTGKIDVAGSLLGQQTKLELLGSKDLLANWQWRNGRFTAKIPNTSDKLLEATWQFERFDLAAWWQKPDQLFLDGTGRASGTWAEPTIAFLGNLEGAKGSLNAKIQADYSDQKLIASLVGDKTTLSGTYEKGVWQAGGRLRKVALATVLPEAIEELETSVDVVATGNTKDIKVAISNLELVGQVATIGAAKASGAANFVAEYNDRGLEGQLAVNNLVVEALKGRVQVNGKLGNATNTTLIANLENLSLEPFQAQGKVSGIFELSGNLQQPKIAGTLRGIGLGLAKEKWLIDTNLDVSKELFNPELSGFIDLRGTASGRVYAAVSNIFSSRPTIDARGEARLPFATAKGNISGQFPNLEGTIDASLPDFPLALRQLRVQSNSSGTYQIRVGQNTLVGELQLTAANQLLDTGIKGQLSIDTTLENSLTGIFDAAKGQIEGQLELSGTLSQPIAAITGDLKTASIAGVDIGNAKVTALYKERLTGLLRFKSGEIKLEPNSIIATDVPFIVAGSKGVLDASGSLSPLDIRFSTQLTGSIVGALDGRYVGDQLALKLDASSNGIRAAGATTADAKDGWSGEIALSGLPKTTPLSAKTKTGTAKIAVSGAFASPILSGGGDIFGAAFALNAKLSPLVASLKLADSAANAAGEIRLVNNNLSGIINYQDEALKLSLAASGTLEQPAATITSQIGKINATAKVQLENAQATGTLNITDGIHNGQITLEQGRINGTISGITLESSGLKGYSGAVDIKADLRQDATSDFGWSGRASAVFQNLDTPLLVPSVGWKIDGTGTAVLETNPVRLLLDYKGTPGLAKGDLRFEQGLWQGDVNVDLRGAEGKGVVKGTVTADARGITGKVNATSLPLSVSQVSATVSGAIELKGDTFTLNGTGKTLGGNVELNGNGGLSDVAPFLETYTKSKPGDQPIDIKISVFTVRLEDVEQVRNIAPNLRGRVNGRLKIVDDVIDFDLIFPEISLPDQNGKRLTLAGEAKGTAAGSSIRYRGFIYGAQNNNPDLENISLGGFGRSIISGSFDGKVATGTLDLRRAPLHGFAAGLFGEMPGTALATGFARYEIPIKNFLASTVKMDFVPLEVSGAGDTLTGNGRLIFSNGDLQFDNLLLRGKGEWRINGYYAKNRVDLGMRFQNTIFTPLLNLLPQIREYNPKASGSLELKLSGKYGTPDAQLNVRDFKGNLGGIAVNASELIGTLEKGLVKVRGVLSSDESLGATLDTTGTAKLVSYTPIKIEDLEAQALGSLNIKPIGLINDIAARAFGDSGGFKLDLTAKKGGIIKLRGDLSPRIKLKLEGKDLVMPIPDYFVSDSLLDADLTFVGDGERFYDIGGQVNLLRLQTQLQQNKPADSTKPVQPTTPNKPNVFLQQVRFRGVTLNAPQGIRINESFAALEAGGKLLLTGTMAVPELNGQLEAVGAVGGKGKLQLGINTYQIQSAVAEFSPIEGFYPVVQIISRGVVKATCKNSSNPNGQAKEIDVILKIRLRWIADTKNPNNRRIDMQPAVDGNCPNGFESLTPAQLYSLVTLGSVNADLGGLAQQSLDTVLSVFILSEISRQIKAATGIDVDFRSNLVEVVAQNLTDSSTQAAVNFTLNFGVDLSRAARLSLQINNTRLSPTGNRVLGGEINLNLQSDDGVFGIRFGTPFIVPSGETNYDLLTIIQPEAQLSINFTSNLAIALTFGLPAPNQFKFSFGFNFRF